MGQLAALILAIIVSIIFVRRWLGGVIAVLLTLAVCVAVWFFPESFSLKVSTHGNGILLRRFRAGVRGGCLYRALGSNKAIAMTYFLYL